MASDFTRRIVAAGLVLAAARSAPAEAPSFSSGVDFVSVNVTVRQSGHGFVHDLGAGDFVVLENGVPQKISSFAESDAPISVALLLDCSGSMTRTMDDLKRASRRLVASLRVQDEVEVVGFNRRPTILQALTSDRSAIEAALERARPEGDTALRTVLYVTLKDMVAARVDDNHRRRAVVLFSDGEDTVSLVSDDAVLAEARRAGISIYSVQMQPPAMAHTEASRSARYLLSSLARESGGDAFFPEQAKALDGVFDKIGDALRSQYNLGYVPSAASGGRSWRQILVSVRRPDVDVRHRLGYYPDSTPAH